MLNLRQVSAIIIGSIVYFFLFIVFILMLASLLGFLNQSTRQALLSGNPLILFQFAGTMLLSLILAILISSFVAGFIAGKNGLLVGVITSAFMPLLLSLGRNIDIERVFYIVALSGVGGLFGYFGQKVHQMKISTKKAKSQRL